MEKVIKQFWLFVGANSSLLLLILTLYDPAEVKEKGNTVFLFVMPVVVMVAIVSSKVLYSKKAQESVFQKMKTNKAFPIYFSAIRWVWINISIANLLTILVFIRTQNMLFIAISAAMIVLLILEKPSEEKYQKDFLSPKKP
jgi:branched-subunit amino acid transport protein